jgi:hypothetical protein
MHGYMCGGSRMVHPSVHPLKGDEMRALRRLKREADNTEYVFVSERESPFTTAGFAKLVERDGSMD